MCGIYLNTGIPMANASSLIYVFARLKRTPFITCKPNEEWLCYNERGKKLFCKK